MSISCTPLKNISRLAVEEEEAASSAVVSFIAGIARDHLQSDVAERGTSRQLEEQRDRIRSLGESRGKKRGSWNIEDMSAKKITWRAFSGSSLSRKMERGPTFLLKN